MILLGKYLLKNVFILIFLYICQKKHIMKKIIFIVSSLILLSFGWCIGKCMDEYRENSLEIEKLRARIKHLESINTDKFELEREQLEENVSLVKTRHILP